MGGSFALPASLDKKRTLPPSTKQNCFTAVAFQRNLFWSPGFSLQTTAVWKRPLALESPVSLEIAKFSFSVITPSFPPSLAHSIQQSSPLIQRHQRLQEAALDTHS